MKHQPDPQRKKPYEIRERLFVFSVDVVRAVLKMKRRPDATRGLSAQLVDAAVSAASNAEEADDGSSRRDFLAKERICLRELKEARLRLRVFSAVDLLTQAITSSLRKATNSYASSRPSSETRVSASNRQLGIWVLGFGIWVLGFGFWIALCASDSELDDLLDQLVVRAARFPGGHGKFSS
jgi:four helix bundle protein